MIVQLLSITNLQKKCSEQFSPSFSFKVPKWSLPLRLFVCFKKGHDMYQAESFKCYGNSKM